MAVGITAGILASPSHSLSGLVISFVVGFITSSLSYAMVLALALSRHHLLVGLVLSFFFLLIIVESVSKITHVHQEDILFEVAHQTIFLASSCMPFWSAWKFAKRWGIKIRPEASQDFLSPKLWDSSSSTSSSSSDSDSS